jgi:hypothetical protein
MPRPVHIIVLVHGLWGDVTHLKVMEDTLLEAFSHPASSSSPPTTGVDVRILRVKGNQNDKTYDGIDINASRVVEELDAEIERLEEEEGLEVKYLSMSGYSLGGLVARYALGILYTRPTFFQRHQPLNFSTFASPWLGSLRYATLFNRLFTIVGSRFISRSGEQLFCVDKEQLIARLARKGQRLDRPLLLRTRRSGLTRHPPADIRRRYLLQGSGAVCPDRRLRERPERSHGAISVRRLCRGGSV